MTEVLFYHLQRQPLEQVLPLLLQKTLERGWRAVVQAGSQERLEALSAAIWSWRDDAFIPHGLAADGHEQRQPVWLTVDDGTPNGATVRFLVDGAELPDISGFERVIYMFDGRDEQAVDAARAQWKVRAGEGHDVTYWRQDEQGRWQKAA